MKIKFLQIIIISLLLTQNSYCNDWNTKIDEVITKEFREGKLALPLGNGEWQLIEKYSDHIGYGISAESLSFAQFENNKPVKIFEIARLKDLGKWSSYISGIIQAEVFKPKNEGCVKRQHYNYLNIYKLGASHNCFHVNILDVKRVLYPSDYDPDTIYNVGLRNYIKKNNIEIPDIYLWYEASFHSMAVRNTWYLVSYGETPEKFANYKAKFTSRDTSEFHPDKIENFPEAKKIMQEWLKKTGYFHKEFENFQKAKNNQKLDLSDIISTEKENNLNTNQISDQLIKLNDLYKSGVLSKDEFEKAKKKIIN